MGLAVTAPPVWKNQAGARPAAVPGVRLVTPVKLWWMSWPKAGQSEGPGTVPAPPAALADGGRAVAPRVRMAAAPAGASLVHLVRLCIRPPPADRTGVRRWPDQTLPTGPGGRGRRPPNGGE